MKYKYFGTINPETLSKLNEKEQNAYLLKRKLFSGNVPILVNFKEDNTTPGRVFSESQLNFSNIRYKCSSILIENIYGYILDKYRSYIDHSIEIFNAKFKDKSFGKKKKEVTKIALNEFNLIYDKIIPFESARLEDRFKVLDRERTFFKSNIDKDRELILNYLYGNDHYLTVDKFDNSDYLKDIVDFESKLSLLLYLNDVYKFAQDDYFSEASKLNKTYSEYSHLFQTKSSFEFTHYLITVLNYTKPTEIESLYEMLVSKKLMVNSKNSFIHFLGKTYDLPIKKIRDYSKKDNNKHKLRVKFLFEKWDDFPKND